MSVSDPARSPRNGLLDALPPEDLERLRPLLTRVGLVTDQVLHERGEAVEHVFFVEEGIVSIVAGAGDADGGTGVGLIGREGVVAGCALTNDAPIAFHRAMVQVPGAAFRMRAAALREEMRNIPALRRRCLLHLEASMAQAAQHSACNARHTVAERCARWLLMAHDRLDGDDVPLTQGFLSMVPAVRRSGVNDAIGILQEAGLVRHSRGRIRIQDRAGLEAAACGCYRLVRDETTRLLERPPLPTRTAETAAGADRLPPPPAGGDAWPAGGGAAGALIRAHDWSRTPLGPVAGWPKGLRAVVDLVLASPVAMVVLWGPELVQVYNDAYAEVAAAKHPAALGQPTRECWPEAWDYNARVYEAVLRGEAHSFQNRRFTLLRRGAPEDAWFDASYSPLRGDDTGAVAGVLVVVVEATGRERTRAALADANRRMAEVLESVGDGFYGIGPDWRFTYVNAAAEALLGVGREELLGRDIWASFPEALGTRFENEYRRAMAERVPVAFEILYEPWDRWFEVRAFPDAAGGGLAVYFVDVTERRRTEAALRESEARFHAIADLVPDLLWSTDASGRTEWHNRRWREYTGRTPEKALGYGWLDALHPEDREPSLGNFQEALDAGAPLQQEQRIRGADGVYRWFLVRSEPLRDAGTGRILRWFGAATNVDAMLRAREALRESEARLAAIIGQAVVGIGQLDPDGRLLLANDALCGILGRPREDVLGRPARELAPPEDRPATDALYARVFETGEPFAVEESRVRPDGATVWVRSRVSPVRGAEPGRPRSAVAVVEDVTERVEAERRQALLLAELNHRVKNVLANVQSLADQTLRSAGGDPARFAADFGGRLRALARAHDLLTKRAWVGAELGDLAGAALAPWLGGGGRERLSIAGCAGSMVGRQQAQALVLALHELATNAAKHGALSRPGGRVEVRCARAPDGLLSLDWAETGGPPVAGPGRERRGFGTRLLERGLAHSLGPASAVELRFEPAGLRASIRFAPAAGQ